MSTDVPLTHLRAVFLTAGADPQKLHSWLQANTADFRLTELAEHQRK